MLDIFLALNAVSPLIVRISSAFLAIPRCLERLMTAAADAF